MCASTVSRFIRDGGAEIAFFLEWNYSISRWGNSTGLLFEKLVEVLHGLQVGNIG